MLNLKDGRAELYQWDTGRRVTVPEDVTQVHYALRPMGRSLDVDVIGGEAEVPDVLLQVPGKLWVWAYVGSDLDGYTKLEKAFEIKRRNKPADYVFTPPQQATLSEILERIKKLEESGGGSGGITTETDPTVPDWAKQPNKPQYTASEVGALPASTKIPAKTSDLQNDSGFVTRLATDLANYYAKEYLYTREEIDAKISAIPKFAISVVSALPTYNISTTTIYLVKSGSGDDLYTEYIYTTGSGWEILGSQRVDLTGYATETWVDAKIADFLTADKLTVAMVTGALGYTPADDEKVDSLSEAIADLGGIVLPDYWESYLPEKIAVIKALQDEGGKDAFTFIVIADPHYSQNLGKNSGKLARVIMDKCDIKHVMVLGDMQSRGSWGTKAEALAEWDSIKEMFAPIADEALFQRGNHDGSWGTTLNGTTYPYNFTPEELYNRVYGVTYKHQNAVTDESGSGYYVDDTARKVRFIMLNTHCNPYAENDDGSARYNNMRIARFTQSQYDMVIDALETIPDDNWAVVVAAHIPINNVYGGSFGDGTNSTGDHIIMRNLLKAYKNKSTYSAEWAGTAGGSGETGGYTNLFDTSGSGYSAWSGTSFLTNWIPYDANDNDGAGTIYHIKGWIETDSPYKFHFANDANGTNASALAYCKNAVPQPLTASDYDSTVKIIQHTAASAHHFIQFEFREDVAANLIITANEPIVEASGGSESGYDAVSVNVDFSDAKGEMVGYFSGHMHNDYVYPASSYGVDIITTRCDGANENDSTLLAERVEGTTTEQSFDVFTVNRRTGTINATKIGAGNDREISY